MRPLDKLLTLMAEPNRFVAWAARRALEQLPTDQWQAAVLSSTNPRVFIHGLGGAADARSPIGTRPARFLPSAGKWLDKNPSDDDLLDLLRVVELAL